MTDQLPVAPEAVTRASKEIMALHTGAELKPVIPSSLEEAFRFAQLVCQAGLAPKSYEYGQDDKRPDPQKVVIGILTSLELGVPPLQGLSGICIINNRPSVWGDLAVALVQSKGLLKSHEVIETGTFPNDDFAITFRAWRIGQEKPYEGKFSVEAAKKAGLWLNAKKQPWISYPRRMIFNRARAFALRDGFSDALKGLAIAEEAADMPIEAKEPVNTAFLEDDSAPVEAVETLRLQSAEPEPETPPANVTNLPEPQVTSDEDRETLSGFITALSGVEILADLESLADDVKEFFSALTHPATELRGEWASAKLERQKILSARKVK